MHACVHTWWIMLACDQDYMVASRQPLSRGGSGSAACDHSHPPRSIPGRQSVRIQLKRGACVILIRDKEPTDRIIAELFIENRRASEIDAAPRWQIERTPELEHDYQTLFLAAAAAEMEAP